MNYKTESSFVEGVKKVKGNLGNLTGTGSGGGFVNINSPAASSGLASGRGSDGRRPSSVVKTYNSLMKKVNDTEASGTSDSGLPKFSSLNDDEKKLVRSISRWTNGSDNTLDAIRKRYTNYEDNHDQLTELATQKVTDRDLTVYRGISLPSQSIGSMQEVIRNGDTLPVLRGSPIQSWSTSEEIASGFSSHGIVASGDGVGNRVRVVMSMRPSYGTDISKLSEYPGEMEFLSGGDMQILDIFRSGEVFILTVQQPD